MTERLSIAELKHRRTAAISSGIMVTCDNTAHKNVASFINSALHYIPENVDKL